MLTKETNGEASEAKQVHIYIEQIKLDEEFKDNGQAEFDREERDFIDSTQPILAKAIICDNNNKETKEEDRSCRIFGYRWNEIKWVNVIWLLFLHLAFLWSYLYVLTSPVKFYTAVWCILTSIFSGFGMSVGAHRYWGHRGFKATRLLRVFLLILQTMTINGSAFSYARDHRNHHKWPASHADPKNPGRGFFFAHIGWWMLKKRPEVSFYGKKVPIDDLLDDQLLMLQHRLFIPLVVVFAFAIPIFVPIYGWDEDPLVSVALCFIRILVVLHHLFTVNSVAHFWGFKPYNRYMKPTENHIINWISMGEGNHNYHHTFPFDYRNSEYVWWEVFNPASLFINCCQVLRLASEPKKPSRELVCKVIEARGVPGYFVDIHQRRMWARIALGVIDWFVGLILAQWPLWIAMAFKTALGYQVFLF